MFKRLIVLSGALIGVAVAPAYPRRILLAYRAVDAIAARQASLDMSSITFRSMGDAMKAGREAKSQGYPAAVLAKWAKALPRMFPAGTGQGETSARFAGAPRNLARPRQLRSGCGQLCCRDSPTGCPGGGQRHRRFHKTTR